jgi:hypothetical protein
MSRLDRFGTGTRGKHVAAEDRNVVDFPMQKKCGKRDGFAQISLKAAAEVAKLTRRPEFAVLVMLAYRAFRTKSQTFIMSNDLLSLYGVGRETKRRVLARLEKDGVIRVERRGRRAPIVTLLIKFD